MQDFITATRNAECFYTSVDLTQQCTLTYQYLASSGGSPLNEYIRMVKNTLTEVLLL